MEECGAEPLCTPRSQMKNTWNDRTANKCVVFSECESVTFAAIRAAYRNNSARATTTTKKNHKRITCGWLCGFLFPSALKVFMFRCMPLTRVQVKLKMDQKILKRFASCTVFFLFLFHFLRLSFRVAHSIRFHVFLKLLFLRFFPAIWFLIISTTTTLTLQNTSR